MVEDLGVILAVEAIRPGLVVTDLLALRPFALLLEVDIVLEGGEEIRLDAPLLGAREATPEPQELASHEPVDQADAEAGLVVARDRDIDKPKTSVGVAERDGRDVNVRGLENRLAVDERVIDEEDTRLAVVWVLTVSEVPRDEAASERRGTGVAAELEDGAACVLAGGDDGDLGGVLDRDQGTSRQEQLLPELLQVEDEGPITLARVDIKLHALVDVAKAEVSGGDDKLLRVILGEREELAGSTFRLSMGVILAAPGADEAVGIDGGVMESLRYRHLTRGTRESLSRDSILILSMAGRRKNAEGSGGRGLRRFLCCIAILDYPSFRWQEVCRDALPFRSMNNFFGQIRERIVRQDINLRKMTERNLYICVPTKDLILLDDLVLDDLLASKDDQYIFVVYFKRRHTLEGHAAALQVIANIRGDVDKVSTELNDSDASHPPQITKKDHDAFDTPSIILTSEEMKRQRVDASDRRFRGALLALSNEDNKGIMAPSKQYKIPHNAQTLGGPDLARSETVLGDTTLNEVTVPDRAYPSHQASTPSEKVLRSMTVTSLYPNRSYAQGLERQRIVSDDHQRKYPTTMTTSSLTPTYSKKSTADSSRCNSTCPHPKEVDGDENEPPRKAGVQYSCLAQISTLSPESPESQSHSSTTPTPVRHEPGRARRAASTRPLITPTLAYPPDDQGMLGTSVPIGMVHLRLPPLPIGLAMRLLQLLSDYNMGLAT